MKITLNGSPHDISDNTTVATLLHQLALDKQRIAVEINEAIIPRAQHSQTQIQPNDRIEIVHAIGGG